MCPPATTADEHQTDVPRIVVAMNHPTMRRYVCDLIERGCRCWLATATPDPSSLHEVIANLHPDAIVLEASRFPQCCPDIGDTFPIRHIIVIGPYPDDAYRDAAHAAGAGAWIPRDHLSADLVHEVHRITGVAGCNCGCQEP